MLVDTANLLTPVAFQTGAAIHVRLILSDYLWADALVLGRLLQDPV